ncbi:MAG: YcaO-like family protein [Sulfobacillus sp.]
MRFFAIGDERFNIPGRIFSSDPYIGYILNGALTIGRKSGPAAGSAISTHKGMAMKKALSEMTDRRALMCGGVPNGNGQVQTWEIVSQRLSELPRGLTTYSSRRPYPSDTTGTAAHPKSDVTICSAVLELIEKNALFLFWYGQHGDRVRPRVYDTNYYDRVFSESQLAVQVYVSRFFSPVLVAFVVASSEDGRVFTGSGADTDLRESIDHAFQEAFLLGCNVIKPNRAIANASWAPVSADSLRHIRALEDLPFGSDGSDSSGPLAEHANPLDVLRSALPPWVSSLHIAYLPQEVRSTIRCASAFSYELYNHRPLPRYLDAQRRINQETLRLSQPDLLRFPVCPLS